MANFSRISRKGTRGHQQHQQDLYDSTLKLNEEDFRIHQNLQDQHQSSVNLKNGSPKYDEPECQLHQNLRDQYESTTNMNRVKFALEPEVLEPEAEPDKVLKRNTILVTKEVPAPPSGGRRRMSPTMRKQYVTYFHENVYKRENKKENGPVGCYFGKMFSFARTSGMDSHLEVSHTWTPINCELFSVYQGVSGYHMFPCANWVQFSKGITRVLKHVTFNLIAAGR